MGRPSKLTPEQWEQVKQAYIAGVPSRRLSEEFCIPDDTIRQRASYENWPTPAKVEKITEKAKENAKQNGFLTVSHNGGKNASELIAETLLANGEQGSLQASNLLLSLLKSATKETLKPLQDAQDVVTAMKGLRLGAGMDKMQTNVQVNLPGWAASVSTEKSVSADFTEITEMPPDCTETDSDAS